MTVRRSLAGAWMVRAACRGVPTAAFFPGADGRVEPEVRALCEGCPVREPCRDYALAGGILLYGYWGGLSERDRRKLRRARRAA